jgi:hypothetical protein
MQLLHDPVPRLRGTFKVAYANNWRRSYVQLARRKELNPRAERWSIETLHKNSAWVKLESCIIREVKFARQNVREKGALSGWRECVCARARARAKREEGWRDLCYRYTSISLDREEPSRSPTPVIDIVARYEEQGVRSTPRGVRSTHWEVEHCDSTQGQCQSRTQKPQHQKDIGHSKKIRKR